MVKNLILVSSVFTAFFSFIYIILFSIIPSISNSSDFVGLSQALICFIAGITFIIVSFKINVQSNIVKLILTCLTLTAVTIVPLIFTPSLFQLVFICISTVFFSIGQTCILTYFWKYAPTEKRGAFGGIICSAFLTTSFILYLIFSRENLFSLISAILIPIILSIIITLIFAKAKNPAETIHNSIAVEKRSLFLYIVPWAIFCIINFTFSKNIDTAASQFVLSNFEAIIIIQAVFPILGTLGGGLLADFIGRKSCIAISITLYGFSMVLSAFFQNGSVLLFSFAIEGISWGMFFALYFFTVWGDMANERNCTKLYALGIGTYFFAEGLGALPLGLTNISPTTSALIACSLIFFTNLPLSFSPELLSLEMRNKWKLERYIKKIKELKHAET